MKWQKNSKKNLKFYSTLSAVGWSLSGYMADLNWIFYASVALNQILMKRMVINVNLNKPENCFRAFKWNNIFGIVLFLGIILGKQDEFSLFKKEKEEKS